LRRLERFVRVCHPRVGTIRVRYGPCSFAGLIQGLWRKTS
jgi:hypothetical protein